jgi:hypothetical protein
MPVQVKAYCPNGGRNRNQPSDYENGKVPCASASEANRSAAPDASDLSDQSKAVEQLKQLGAQRYPSASPSTQFERALVDPANHKLARRAVPVPRATTSYEFPR